MNVLVVDDEPQFQLLLRTFLVAEGKKVYTAENGEDALALMERTGIDLVISDVYMPVMDGIKFHRTLREIPGYEQVPFLFVSGFDDQYTLEAVKNPKIDGFFKKGRPMAELREWVTYLTAPEDKRPKLPPGGRDIGKAERLDRADRRGGTRTPRL
jgi:CheY-like chemotaxis protein